MVRRLRRDRAAAQVAARRRRTRRPGRYRDRREAVELGSRVPRDVRGAAAEERGREGEGRMTTIKSAGRRADAAATAWRLVWQSVTWHDTPNGKIAMGHTYVRKGER